MCDFFISMYYLINYKIFPLLKGISNSNVEKTKGGKVEIISCNKYLTLSLTLNCVVLILTVLGY